jgi:hypothetical protein
MAVLSMTEWTASVIVQIGALAAGDQSRFTRHYYPLRNTVYPGQFAAGGPIFAIFTKLTNWLITPRPPSGSANRSAVVLKNRSPHPLSVCTALSCQQDHAT